MAGVLVSYLEKMNLTVSTFGTVLEQLRIRQGCFKSQISEWRDSFDQWKV